VELVGSSRSVKEGECMGPGAKGELRKENALAGGSVELRANKGKGDGATRGRGAREKGVVHGKKNHYIEEGTNLERNRHLLYVLRGSTRKRSNDEGQRTGEGSVKNQELHPFHEPRRQNTGATNFPPCQ